MDLASQLLHNILEGGHLVSEDGAGNAVIRLAIEPADLERLAFYAAGAAGYDCGNEGAAQALARLERWLVAAQRN